MLADCVAQWRALPHADRAAASTSPACRWHDPDENAAIVNALQRHAAIVVQKSLAEGFGLTVAEAMWKQRPIVGERGRRHRRPDRRRRARASCWTTRPTSPASARRSSGSSRDPADAAADGRPTRGGGRPSEFLGDRHLEQYAELFMGLA